MALISDKDNVAEAEKQQAVLAQDNSPAMSHRTSMDQIKDNADSATNEKEKENDEAVVAVAMQNDEQPDKEIDYIHGWKLASVMLALTLATFLMLLDVSILVTVSALI